MFSEPGEVAEWPNVPDSKSGVPQGTVGSNPTFSSSQWLKNAVFGTAFSFPDQTDLRHELICRI